MAPASFTTLKVRSRRPDTAEPRLQVMILVASFWAHCRRVMPRQPARFGSVLISAGVMAATLSPLQYSTALPPRKGHRVNALAVLNSSVSLPAPPPMPPPLLRSAQVTIRRQLRPLSVRLPDLGQVFDDSQVAPGLSSARRRPPSQMGCTLLTPPVLKATVWKGVEVSGRPSPATLPDAVPSSLKRSTTTLLKLGLAGFVSSRTLMMQSCVSTSFPSGAPVQPEAEKSSRRFPNLSTKSPWVYPVQATRFV